MPARRDLAPALGGLAACVVLVVLVAWLVSDGEPAGTTAPPVRAPELDASAPALTRSAPAEPILDALPAVEPEPAVVPDAALLSMLADPPPEPRTVTVLVVDGERRPVPDARVELRRADDPDEPGFAVLRTDGLGRCTGELPGAGAWLFAEAEGVGTSGLWSLWALRERSDEDGTVVVPLRPTAVIRGRVQTADGRPVPGAGVRWSRRPGPLMGRKPQDQVSDLDGGFEAVVDAGSRLLVVASDGARTTPPVMLDAGPGTLHEPNLVLPGRWAIDGVLFDPSGEPVVGGSVTLWRTWPGYDVQAEEFPPDPPYRAETQTDAEGAFHFDLPELGLYTLVGGAEARPPSAPAEVWVSGDRPRGEAWLQLPEPSSISGRLVDDSGAGIAGIVVHARPAHLYSERAMEYAPTPWGLYGRADLETGADGSFLLAPLHPDGVYIVFVRPDEERRDRKLVVKDVPAGTRDLLLVASEQALQRGTLEGHVVSALTGQPIDAFRTTLVIELDGRIVETGDEPVREEGGAFRFEGLAPGYAYALRVDAEGFGPVELPLQVLWAGGAPVQIALPALGSLEVEAGVPFADVAIQRVSQYFDVDPLRRGHADELGRALWPELAPGSYEVVVDTGRGQHVARVEVHPGESTLLQTR